MHRRALLAAIVAVACEQGVGSVSDDDSMIAEDENQLPAPTFLEPVSGSVTFPMTRTADASLEVTSISLGRTSVVLDAQTLGPLGPGSELGVLTKDSLTLHIAGAIVPGVRVLQMRTLDQGEQLDSREIDIDVTPVLDPALRINLVETVVAQGDTVFATGPLGGDVLVVVTTAPEPTATLMLPAQGTWDHDNPIELPLPGLSSSQPRPVEVTAAVRSNDLGSPVVRAAWTVGDPGHAFEFVEFIVDQAMPSPQTAFDTSDPLVGRVEYASVERPLLVGDTLLGQLFAAADVERPLPGDRGLVRIPLRGSPTAPGVAQAVDLGARQNIDSLGPAIDLRLASANKQRVGARMADTTPIVIEIDPNSSAATVRPGEGNRPASSLRSLTGTLSTILGALDSRWVFGLGDNGDLTLLQIDDRGRLGIEDMMPSVPEGIALNQATGPMVVTVAAGAPLALIPMGDRPVLALIATRVPARTVALEDLQCDEIALSASAEGNVAGMVALACLRAGELRVGSLQIVL